MVINEKVNIPLKKMQTIELISSYRYIVYPYTPERPVSHWMYKKHRK